MLTAAAIAVLMKRLHENRKVEMNKICIGIDGSLYRFHPRFNMVIQRHLKILAPVLLNYELRISADGIEIVFSKYLSIRFYLTSGRKVSTRLKVFPTSQNLCIGTRILYYFRI
jgi:hypothetical protein